MLFDEQPIGNGPENAKRRDPDQRVAHQRALSVWRIDLKTPCCISSTKRLGLSNSTTFDVRRWRTPRWTASNVTDWPRPMRPFGDAGDCFFLGIGRGGTVQADVTRHIKAKPLRRLNERFNLQNRHCGEAASEIGDRRCCESPGWQVGGVAGLRGTWRRGNSYRSRRFVRIEQLPVADSGGRRVECRSRARAKCASG